MAVNWIAFSCTDRCQLRCRHCLRDPAAAPTDLDLPLVAKVLDQARQLYGCEHVGLTGGEPTLHPRFPQLVEAIVSRGYTWHIVTNGIDFHDRVLRLFDDHPGWQETITAVDFSVDGATEAVHDRIRGDGSFRAVMHAITHCSARGLKFMLQMTLNATNAHQVDAFALMACHLGACRISFAMMQPAGRSNDRELSLSPAALRSLQDDVARLDGELKIPVACTEGFHSPRPFHTCDSLGSEVLNIDERGRLVLCCQLSGVAGNGPRKSEIADLHAVSLPDAHGRMLDLVHRFQKDKLEAIRHDQLGEWDLFPCNYCGRYFDKPHWTQGGPAGPAASGAS